MVESFKAKLVGGKVIFDNVTLSVNLPVYNPNRNVEFVLKVY
jgi:hypothetical protein